jgi:hypothetical protein
MAQSLAYEIETSICSPAYGVRSIRHSSHPCDRPDEAFHSPDVPVPEQSDPWYCSSQGCSSNHPAGQLSPVSFEVWPLRSGAVAHVSAATSWISTNTKSHSGSVSYENWNVISPPDSGTAIVCINRL